MTENIGYVRLSAATLFISRTGWVKSAVPVQGTPTVTDMRTRYDYDAVIVGSGLNGLAAAITLQRAGLSVLLLEAGLTLGGELRTTDLTLPGFQHDVYPTIHPMTVSSPFMRTLPLAEYGLNYVKPPVAVAHPFDDGSVALLQASITDTAHTLGIDINAYQRLIRPLLEQWPTIERGVTRPLHPRVLRLASFAAKALLPAPVLANRLFRGEAAKGLLVGVAAHSPLPLHRLTTSATGLMLTIQAHRNGWPLPQGGSQSIADALIAYFIDLGGRVYSNAQIESMRQLPASRVVLFDLPPARLLTIAGHKLSSFYQWQLARYPNGNGLFKVDYALNGPIPFRAKGCDQAGIVHLGGTMTELAAAEQDVARGRHPERPVVVLAQPSRFDPGRAPVGKHTAWAYCHVPNGSTVNMTTAIELQIERFAPGFRDLILSRHTMNTADRQRYNAPYQGGDINGGRADLTQLFTRLALRALPYRTSVRGLYLCSASTPPGGGVHGMCGYHAARQALHDEFPYHQPLPVSPAVMGGY